MVCGMLTSDIWRVYVKKYSTICKMPIKQNKAVNLQTGVSSLLLVIIVVAVIGAIGVFFGKDLLKKPVSVDKTATQQPEFKDLIKVKTTLPLATPTEPLVLLIKKYGLDKKNGLDVEFVPLNIGDTEREFFAGNIQIRIGGPLSSVESAKKGDSFKILAPIIRQPYHVIVPINSSITDLAGLKGKKFAIPPKITASSQSITTILRAAGIDPEKDFNRVFVTPDQIVKLLEDGEVDAGAVINPFGAQLLTSGKYRSIANLEDVWKKNTNGLEMPFVLVLVHDNWYQNNKEAARRYIKMFHEAARMVKDNPKILEELPEYLAKNKLNTPEALKMMESEYPKLLFTSWDQNGYDGMMEFYKLGKKYKIIPENVPAAETLLVLPSELGF